MFPFFRAQARRALLVAAAFITALVLISSLLGYGPLTAKQVGSLFILWLLGLMGWVVDRALKELSPYEIRKLQLLSIKTGIFLAKVLGMLALFYIAMWVFQNAHGQPKSLSIAYGAATALSCVLILYAFEKLTAQKPQPSISGIPELLVRLSVQLPTVTGVAFLWGVLPFWGLGVGTVLWLGLVQASVNTVLMHRQQRTTTVS